MSALATQVCLVMAGYLALVSLGLLIAWLRSPASAINAPAACGRRVCAWCVPMRDLGPAPGIPAGCETHGLCEACEQRVLAELQEVTTP